MAFYGKQPKTFGLGFWGIASPSMTDPAYMWKWQLSIYLGFWCWHIPIGQGKGMSKGEYDAARP